MLRLTQTRHDAHEVVLKAEGQVVAEWVGLLEGECLRLMANGRVLLDLSDVSYADRHGVQVLRELAKGPVTIIRCAPLVEELLQEEPA